MAPATKPLVAAWSYSRYSCYDACPAQFKFKHIDKLPEPERPAFEKGNRWHKLAEDFLVGKLEVLPTELKRFSKQFHELRAMEPFVEQEWGFNADWLPTGWFAPDTWLRGKIDAGVIYPDQTADIVDHKTGKMYGANEDQIELFGLTVMCRYREVKCVSARLWYLESGDEIIREFESKDREKLKKKWEQKVSPMFLDRRFAPKPGKACRWCAFSKSQGGPCKF